MASINIITSFSKNNSVQNSVTLLWQYVLSEIDKQADYVLMSNMLHLLKTMTFEIIGQFVSIIQMNNKIIIRKFLFDYHKTKWMS